MRKILFIIPFFLWTCGGDESSPTEPSTLEIQHGKMYGGAGREIGRDVQATSDGGFILAGYTDSFGSGGYDVYVVKTNASGSEMWSQTFGGSDDDIGQSIKETSDGGFILAGQSRSFGAGGFDVYVVKTDASGNEIWSQTFGGSAYDSAYSIEETSDGGYIIGGTTRPDENEGRDMYLIKIDTSGNEIWSQTFGEGGNGHDVAYSTKETLDGGFILAGFTESSTTGAENMYLVKTNSSGNEMWSQILEVSSVCRSVEQTLDGGFILGCGMYLVKTDASGNEIWSQNFQGEVAGGDVAFYDLLKISDGGYIMAGYTQTDSFGHDMYVIKIDASGSEMWRKTHGEESWLLSQNIQLMDPTFPSSTTSEIAYSIDETSDGGFILGGETSLVSRNMYLIKMDSEGNRIF